MWRSWDRPIVGTIFRLPDITALVRGITFTILPDGQSMRVPAMHRAEVRAHSNRHAEGEETEIMQALSALGFRRDAVIDIIPSQHVFVFKKTEAH